MSAAERHGGPWYHHFWPWFIVALLGTTVAAGIATVVIAVRSADSLVVDDYYRNGKAINRSLAADREAALREARARVRIALPGDAQADGVRVALQILGDAPPAIDLSLSHVTRAERDERVRLEPDGSGAYVSDRPLPQGRFYLTLEPAGVPATWRLRRRVDLGARREFSLAPATPAEPAG